MTSSFDPDLPFFSYGIFKPGQLGYFRIQEYVSQVQDGEVEGNLWIRDGIPLLDGLDSGTVEGSIIWFSSDHASTAYDEIKQVEPESQYYPDTIAVTTENDESQKANVLVGVNPDKGGDRHTDLHGDILTSWDGRRDDPLFNEALEIIEETKSQYGDFEPGNIKSLLQLQMAYLLLWISLERYAALRYGFTLNSSAKRENIANDEAFAKGLEEVISKGERRGRTEVRRTDDPSETRELKPEDPDEGLEKDSVEYYYQVRSNIVHRGKGAMDTDFQLMIDCLQELYEIYCSYVLPAAFEEY